MSAGTASHPRCEQVPRTRLADIDARPLDVRFTPKADIGTQLHNVRFVPKADIDLLIDQLVGAGAHARWHIEAEPLGGFEIDDKFILGGCLHWHVGWLLALEDAIGVAGRLPVQRDLIGLIGNKAASGDEGALEVDA
jgi:hypothetical protein